MPTLRPGRKPATTTRLGRTLLANDISVRELATVTGINERTLSEYLSGRRRPDTVNQRRIRHALGVGPEVFQD